MKYVLLGKGCRWGDWSHHFFIGTFFGSKIVRYNWNWHAIGKVYVRWLYHILCDKYYTKLNFYKILSTLLPNWPLETFLKLCSCIMNPHTFYQVCWYAHFKYKLYDPTYNGDFQIPCKCSLYIISLTRDIVLVLIQIYLIVIYFP